MTMRLFLDDVASPLGRLLLVTDEAGRLRALDFDAYAARLHRLLARHYAAAPGAYALAAGAAARRRARPARGVLRGRPCGPGRRARRDRRHAVPARRVAVLRTVPPGTTTSYGALAARLGTPGGARAVGLANGANPVAVVVPCHRVVGAGGALTGYAGGVDRKRWLLEHERHYQSHTCTS